MNNSFLVDECETSIGSDGKTIKIKFSNDNGDSQEVLIDRQHLPQFVAQLQNKTVSGSGKPIERASLRPEETFAVSGFRVEHVADGGCVIVVSVNMIDQNRLVTIPLDFSPKDIETLFSMIIHKQSAASH